MLWTGDLVFRERIPALDGSIVGWLADIDELAKNDAAMIVPGHGAATRDIGAALASERRYLEAVRDGVRAALAGGRSIEQAAQEVGSERTFTLAAVGHRARAQRFARLSGARMGMRCAVAISFD